MTEYKPYSGSEPYIFVSYSHKDSKLVLPIIEQMQQDGYRVWYDKGIPGGVGYAERIAKQIANCTDFIAFVTEHFITSQWCKRELHLAEKRNRTRFLVYLDGTVLTDELEMLHGELEAVLRSNYTDDSAFFEKLYESVGMELCRGDVPAAQPIEPIAPPPTSSSDIPRDISLFIDNDFVIEGNSLKKYKGSDAVVCVPEGISMLRQSAFLCCVHLTDITLPNSLIAISNAAFMGCSNLMTVKLPNSLRSIRCDAFRDCTNLPSIMIPASVHMIYPGAFKNCSSLKTVYLSRHTEVHKTAFENCHPDLQFIYTD